MKNVFLFFYCNIFLSHHCVQKYCVLHGPYTNLQSKLSIKVIITTSTSFLPSVSLHLFAFCCDLNFSWCCCCCCCCCYCWVSSIFHPKVFIEVCCSAQNVQMAEKHINWKNLLAKIFIIEKENKDFFCTTNYNNLLSILISCYLTTFCL